MRLALVVLLAEGHLLIEDVPGVGQDDPGQGAGRLDRRHRPADPVHPRPAAERRHRRGDLRPGDPGVRVQARARSSPTSSSPTRSTAPRPRPSPPCWSAWRSARSPSTASATSWPGRSWSWPRRTRWRWRGPIPSPRPSATGSPPGSRWATPAARPSWRCSTTAADRRSRSSTLTPVADAADRARPGRPPSAACTSSEAVRRYVVALVEASRRSPHLRLGASPRAGLQLLRAARASAALLRPRPRAARRRPGAGRARCWRTGCCSPPTRRSAGAAPSRSSPSCCPPSRSPAGAEPPWPTPVGRALSSLTAARALPGRRRRRRCCSSASCSASGRSCSSRSSCSRCRCSRRPTVARERFRLGVAAHGHPRPGPPRRDRRRPPRDHQRRHPPRRPVGADRAAARPTSAARRGSWSTGWPAGDTAALRLPRARRPPRPARRSARCGCGWSTRSGSSSAAPSAPTPRRCSSSPGCGRSAPAGPAGGHGGGGEGSRRTIAVHGEDDVSTREYRHGDDLRKVHWRATARTGELMVRLEERPWRAQATLLLDTRARAHLLAPRHRRPSPAAGPAAATTPRPPDSLEWLVEAAASIGTALARAGRRAARGHRRRRAGARLRPRPAQPGRPAGPAGHRRPLPRLRPGAPAWSSCAGPPATGRSICLLGAVGPGRRRRADPRAARGRPPTSRSSPTSRAGPTPGPPGAGAALSAAARGRPRPAARGRGHPAARRPAGGWPSPVPTGRSPTSGPTLGGPAGAPPALPGGGAGCGGAGMNERRTSARTAVAAAATATLLGACALTPVFSSARLAAAGARRRRSSSWPAACCCGRAARRCGRALTRGPPGARPAVGGWASRSSRSASCSCVARACSPPCSRPATAFAGVLPDADEPGRPRRRCWPTASAELPRAGDPGPAADRPARPDRRCSSG